MNFFIITSFTTAFIALYLGALVFIKNKKDKVNQTFGLFSLAIFVWSFSYAVWLLQVEAMDALLWSRALNIGAVLIPVSYFHWISSFLNRQNIERKKIMLAYLLTLATLTISPTQYFISHVQTVGIFPFWPQAGSFYIVYLATCYIPLSIYCVYLLLNAIRHSSGLHREQIKYIAFGSIIGFGAGASNFIHVFGINTSLIYLNPLTILFPTVLGYTIIKHKLMDIKLAMKRYTVYSIALLAVVACASTLKYLFQNAHKGYALMLDLLILLFAITFFPVIKKIIYEFAAQNFFSSLYDSQKLIRKISDQLRTTLDAGKIFEIVSSNLLKAFHSQGIGFFILNRKDSRVSLKYKHFDNAPEIAKSLGNKKAFASILSLQKITLIDDLKQSSPELYSFCSKLKFEIFIPLVAQEKTIGIIIIGPKESGDIYNEEDLQVLEVVSSQAAIALENAQLYEKTLDFNKELKMEVSTATKELTEANAKLMKLDEAKSEFISIASHQLRTPLTVIKGYISMILDNNFGPLGEKQRMPLEKVFQSNERLIQLVENLLNISRIESGRLHFDYQVMHLEDLCDSVIDELQSYAKKKDLTLNWSKPATPLPTVNMDQEKIRQVVMNITDNSIKYTKQGTVSASIRQVGEMIEYTVSDSGMGISPTDLPNLFKKFSRGTGTSLVHTEGTGLGLYVARQMVETHNGKIWAESRGEGMGSKFVFQLPIYKGETKP